MTYKIRPKPLCNNVICILFVTFYIATVGHGRSWANVSEESQKFHTQDATFSREKRTIDSKKDASKGSWNSINALNEKHSTKHQSQPAAERKAKFWNLPESRSAQIGGAESNTFDHISHKGNDIYKVQNEMTDVRDSKHHEDGGNGEITIDEQLLKLYENHTVKVLESDARNLSRQKRQRSTEIRLRHHKNQKKRRRRHKRRHRLLMKAKGKKYMTDSMTTLDHKGDYPDRDERYLLRSDSPGYVIASASQVKKDWCHTLPLRQKVSEPNCRSKTIVNNFCYGQCNSFFIPHTGKTGNKVAFQSCAFCKPHRPKWENVTLHCYGQNPPKVEKTILVVESCRCITEVLQ